MNKVPQQIIPLIILFLLIITALIVARNIFIPDTFGDLGHYRANAVIEIADQKLVYAGSRTCIECHDDIHELKGTSYHKKLSCESCHGPAVLHTEEPGDFTPKIPNERSDCLICHNYNPSRPSGFPQVQFHLHNAGQSCITCHNPHNPEPPHVPEQCNACHREIASEKAVSHHAALDCTKCHNVPEDHRSTPRIVRAEKPTSNKLCGQCHDLQADSPKGIPRIDLDTHGESYFCWDCHYPHFPEAN